MKYCILIELTRDTISFLYNKESGENRFTSFTEEAVMPLSVLCNGTQLSVGDYARDEVRRGNKNAYDHLFDVMQQRERITYRGASYDINKLLFLVIEEKLKDFFERFLFGNEGSLDDNRKDLPLLLWFGNDLRDNERSLVHDGLCDSGYGHVEVVDSNTLLLEALPGKKAQAKAHLFVGRSEGDLYCRLRVGKSYSSEFRIEKVANDPRIGRAEDIIWSNIKQGSYYPLEEERKRDEQIVHDIAKRFVQSGRAEVEDTLTLSSGNEVDYLISLSDLNAGGRHTLPDAWIRGKHTIVEELETQKLETKECHVVLADKDAATDYIKSLFNDIFPTTIKPDDSNREQARSLLLADVKKRNYQIGETAPHTPSTSSTSTGDKPEGAKEDTSHGGANRTSDAPGTSPWLEKTNQGLENSNQGLRPTNPGLENSNQGLEFSNPRLESEDAKAKLLFAEGNFKEARDAYRSLNATKFANEIKLCSECAKQKRELPHVNDAEKHKILDHWKQLGVKREVIAELLEKAKPQTPVAKKPEPTPRPKRTTGSTSKPRTKVTTPSKPNTSKRITISVSIPPTAKTAGTTTKPVGATTRSATTKVAPSKPTISAREFRERHAEYKAMIRTGRDEKKGREGLIKLRDELKRAGIHDFDDKLKETFKELNIKP